MTFLRGALPLCLLATASLVARAAEPLSSPETGVVVLRSGQTLAGQIERVGDRYLVHIGSGAKWHLPAAEVDLHCRTLDEAYQKKKEYVAPDSARQHLDLADWCLKQGLLRRAAEELSAALTADPEEPRIAVVERRLREALERPTLMRVAAKPPTPAKNDDFEAAMQSISAAAVERFTTGVQPVLLNRCATSSCHGTASKSAFKLLRPAAGDALTRKYTLRNLHAVLKVVDQDAPEASPLLTAPRSAHGSAATAVFGQRDERQYEQLVHWVKLAVESKDAKAAMGLAASDPHLRQSNAAPADRVDAQAPAPLQPTPSENPMGRDPFDPEIFNRKFRPDPK